MGTDVQCCMQYGDNIKFPWSNKMDLKHWMQVIVQIYNNAPSGNKVLYSEMDLSQQPLLTSLTELALGKRGLNDRQYLSAPFPKENDSNTHLMNYQPKGVVVLLL